MCGSTLPPQGFCEIWENKRKNSGKIKGDFWGSFEGFGPLLGFSHPTHPHLGKFSLKNFFLYLSILMTTLLTIVMILIMFFVDYDDNGDE